MPLTLMIFYGFLSICRYFARIFHGDVDVEIVKIDWWFRLLGLGKSKNEIKVIQAQSLFTLGEINPFRDYLIIRSGRFFLSKDDFGIEVENGKSSNDGSRRAIAA